MVNLALWLSSVDSVWIRCRTSTRRRSPLDVHHYTGKNPLSKIGYKSEDVVVPKGDKQRRLHKALLRYHDPKNWPLIRQALEEMGKKHLIGSRRDCLVPAPTLEECAKRAARPQYAPGAQAHANCASAFEVGLRGRKKRENVRSDNDDALTRPSPTGRGWKAFPLPVGEG
ncbi:MAG: DUF3362 domain-containing protein [Enterobacter hormaechei]